MKVKIVTKNNQQSLRLKIMDEGFEITKHLVELQSGTIEVKSELHKGTDVILIFPY